MRTAYDKKQIAQLLDKFMAGTTTLAEEQQLAQYFRSEEVEADWKPYQEMFALFDQGQVEVPQTGQVEVPETPKVTLRPKVLSLRWALTGIAANFILVVGLYWCLNEQQPLSDAPTTAQVTQPSEELTAPETTEAQIDSSMGLKEAKPMPAAPAARPAKTLTPKEHRPAVAQQKPQRDIAPQPAEQPKVESAELPDQQLMADYIASNFMTLEEQNLIGGHPDDLEKALMDHQPSQLTPLNGIGQMIVKNYD